MGISTIERSLVCIHIAIPNYTADSNTVISIIRCRMWMPLLALTALALMPAAYGQGECAEGFTLLGASCYAVVGERVPLAAARASCEELDSELVAIETKQEFINIKSWLSGEVAAHNPKPAFDLWVNAVC